MSSERNWRQAMKAAIRDPDELCRAVGLDDRWREPARRAAAQFPVFAPLEFLARVVPGDPFDPLLRQVLPLEDETRQVPGYSPDPVGDGPARREAGLLQKYAGRALLITTGACAIHCRYCFRRHYPYDETPRSLDAWAPAFQHLAADTTLDEVLLSGGDPLTLVDEQLAALAHRLAAIPHLRRLRIHTRLPIVIPQRVDDALLAWLRGTRLAPIMVIHANHPAEIDDAVATALGRLVDAGIPVLNQAVLLHGVNDNVEALAELSRRLVNLRVLPYYLHQLDRVAGAAHFEVPIPRGQELVKELEAQLPGYAVPRYVREIPGAESKTRVE
jgi:EF-P beta-lysylation protein EpmB